MIELIKGRVPPSFDHSLSADFTSYERMLAIRSLSVYSPVAESKTTSWL